MSPGFAGVDEAAEVDLASASVPGPREDGADGPPAGPLCVEVSIGDVAGPKPGETL